LIKWVNKAMCFTHSNVGYNVGIGDPYKVSCGGNSLFLSEYCCSNDCFTGFLSVALSHVIEFFESQSNSDVQDYRRKIANY